jgi:FkbM family methyltransferase
MMRAKMAVKSWIHSAATGLGNNRLGRVVFEQISDASMMRAREVSYHGTTLAFIVPNSLNHFRVATFATKEPETLEWIDAIPQGSILWDIGANVGLYTCYAAKARACRVFAFEPSVFNLELLARNIFLNDLTDTVTIVSLPLFARLEQATLNMTTTEWGGALSTFREPYGYDGKALEKKFEFRTVGMSMDEAVARLGVPYPDYIKMDVDGIEHLILGGGDDVLKRVKGVSIEITDAFEMQADESKRLLEAAGLRFVAKRHADMFEDNDAYKQTFNQVWARESPS